MTAWEEIVCPDHPGVSIESDFGDSFCTACGAEPSIVVSVTARDEETAEDLTNRYTGTSLKDAVAVALAAAREGYPL